MHLVMFGDDEYDGEDGVETKNYFCCSATHSELPRSYLYAYIVHTVCVFLLPYYYSDLN